MNCPTSYTDLVHPLPAPPPKLTDKPAATVGQYARIASCLLPGYYEQGGDAWITAVRGIGGATVIDCRMNTGADMGRTYKNIPIDRFTIIPIPQHNHRAPRKGRREHVSYAPPPLSIPQLSAIPGGLFKQLGLANGKAEIDAFLREHRLAEGQALPKAPFWNKAQAQFLSEALAGSGELWTMAKQARKCHDIAGLRLHSPQDATDAVADRGGGLAGGAGLRVARRGDRGGRGFQLDEHSFHPDQRIPGAVTDRFSTIFSAVAS